MTDARIPLRRQTGEVHSWVKVDHINRDKLDNQRANLRIVPAGTQPQNLNSRDGSSSRFRGVTLRGNNWVAQAGARAEDGADEYVYLGMYRREEEAAAAAAQWRHEHFPLAVEDPVLLAMSVTPLRPRRVSEVERTTVLLLEMSTSLSRRQIEEATGVTTATIARFVGPGSKLKCVQLANLTHDPPMRGGSAGEATTGERRN